MNILSVIISCWLVLSTAGWVSAETADAVSVYTVEDCASCHEEMAEDLAASVHASVACLHCHEEAAAEEHEGTVASVRCKSCHAPHHEKITHDAHSRVSCRACHQIGGLPVLNPETGDVHFSPVKGEANSTPHRAIGVQNGDFSCKRCHYPGNKLGASSMTLPPKSVLCMPCHAATFSAGDIITLPSLLLFGFGMIGLAIFWFSGGHDKHVSVVWASVVEILLLKRLYRLSPLRWAIHGLIYYAIVIRLAIGLVALILSLCWPDTLVSARMLDKNSAFQGWVFDLTGLMMLAGVTAALVRDMPDKELPGLPAAGRGMTGLLGGITLTGFVVEGVRIAMAGLPTGVNHAPVGYGISLLFKGMTGLNDLHGILWYLHAILAGVFVAFIPFTRMRHIVTGPLAIICFLKKDTEYGNSGI